MAFRVCKTFEIESGHMLSKHPDLCRFPHGHSRRVELVVEADGLDRNDMVCDFKVFKECMAEHLEAWDHALCMNTRDPRYAEMKSAYGERIVGFESVDPTTEVLAKTLFEALKVRLAAYARRPDARFPVNPNLRVTSVRLWETSTSWAEYSE